jgi:23S rRNA (uracil1939-C5)-methyltransferase
VLEPSPWRRAAPCPNGPACGGCTYQDILHEEQLRLKQSVLRESLARAGVPFDGPIPVHASAELGWRLRASLHFAIDPGGLRLGFREQGTHRVADHRACQQLSGALNAAASDLRAALARRPGVQRQLRSVDLLEAPDGSALVASVASVLAPREASSLAGTLAQVPAITGIGVACRPRRLQWLHGDPHVAASVLGLELRAHVGSFLQSNRFLLEGLAREVRDLVPREGGSSTCTRASDCSRSRSRSERAPR